MPKPEATKTVMIAMRVEPSRLASIDRKAKRASMSRTEFMLEAASLFDPPSLRDQLDELGRRVAELERWQRLST